MYSGFQPMDPSYYMMNPMNMGNFDRNAEYPNQMYNQYSSYPNYNHQPMRNNNNFNQPKK